ncbi:MAG: hypothetical protein OEL89_02885 [Candidatus Peregrinibacteria bacterium]|nr:hypothetical protein [Candidatus Peregrinibacteria bacterium]
MENKTNNKNDWSVCDDSFGYLAYLLNQNKEFSELHLPSLNKVKIKGSDIVMVKKIPIQFSKRVSDICSIIKSSKNTNLKIIEKHADENFIILKTSSTFGETINSNNLSPAEKNKILDLFFKYHLEINRKDIIISANYDTFFNSRKFKQDISSLRNKIDSLEKSSFDKKVLNYIDTISALNINPNFKKLKMKNVHGDFILRNIIKKDDNYCLIDLDMAHKGYLEIQYIRILKELFGLATQEFFRELKKRKSLLSNISGSELFDFYLLHKIHDLALLKSTYFTNEKKYNELKGYISSQIGYMMNLINNRDKFLKKFEDNL